VVPVLATWLLQGGHATRAWLMRGWPRAIAAAGMGAGAPSARSSAMALAARCCRHGLFLRALGKTFMPTMDEGDILVQLEKLPSINLRARWRPTWRVQKRSAGACPRSSTSWRAWAPTNSARPDGPERDRRVPAIEAEIAKWRRRTRNG
jgi:cobalt-zinc-cadmium resistance protein CzcA